MSDWRAPEGYDIAQWFADGEPARWLVRFENPALILIVREEDTDGNLTGQLQLGIDQDGPERVWRETNGDGGIHPDDIPVSLWRRIWQTHDERQGQ